MNNDFMSIFPRFMMAMRGKNPNVMLKDMMQRGEINQQQLDAAQAKMREISGEFDGFMSMFGFKK